MSLTPPLGPDVQHAALLRACRSVVHAAGSVATIIATDPTYYLPRLAAIDPQLGTAVRSMTDSVFDLDYRTGYLEGLPRLRQGGGPALPG